MKYKNRKFEDWKEYFFDKFSSENNFIIENFDNENEHIESYRVKTKDESCQTEIIFQIFIAESPISLFDIYFNNPNSPILTSENNSRIYGLDGNGERFNMENLIHTEDYLDIPLFYGWQETTVYFKGKENKTNVIWIQNGKVVEIPIKQNFLKSTSCLLLPIIPFILFWNSLKLSFKKKEVKIETKVIEPIFNPKSTAANS